MVKDEAKEEGKEMEAQHLLCAIFKAFSAVTKDCPDTRQSFEHRVGHLQLFGAIEKVMTPTEQVLQEALNMVSPTPPPSHLSEPHPLSRFCRWWRVCTDSEMAATLYSTPSPSRCCFTGSHPCLAPSSSGSLCACWTCVGVALRTANAAAWVASSPQCSPSSQTLRPSSVPSHSLWKVCTLTPC